MIKKILSMFKKGDNTNKIINETMFEKVSYSQFEKDMHSLYPDMDIDTITSAYNKIKLPERATHASCGYDIVTPIDILIKNGEEKVVPLGIRCKMNRNQALLLAPRSGIGFRSGISLANTIGVIDSDYYYANNEGHIMAKLVGGFNELALWAGDKFLQGIFINYGITNNDVTTNDRTGGFGSTGN